ncbi:DUF445 family protein, partial [Ferrovum sp.]|uniref:phospholipase D family protein n=1 Tax=Ferrovum sp. TaxID=2609467 RepID=UPI002627D342
MVREMEVNVGKDLQYIRVSGTLVGGTAGLALYGMSSALSSLLPTSTDKKSNDAGPCYAMEPGHMLIIISQQTQEASMFIDSTKYKKEVLALIDGSTNIDIAIAFWGQGADKVICGAANKGKTIRIICNLLSGGTNPAPIQTLISCDKVEIKHITSLHAKVILGDAGVVVGSANFSTDGLNHEEEETSGWDEAGLKTTDSNELNEAAIAENPLDKLIEHHNSSSPRK